MESDSRRGKALNAAFSERYLRHLLLPEIGESGQRKLSKARVLLVGAGGLAAPAALYLAAGGVGRIGVVDNDLVEISNLQRQVLFSQADLGRSKLEVMKERLLLANPDLVFEGHERFLTAANADEILCGYDLGIDCTDNFAARYALNDACLRQGKSFVYGGLHRFEGQVSVFGAGGPCYRCLFPEQSALGLEPCGEKTGIPSCAEAGVLGVLPGIIGSLQALEAIKMILSIGDCLRGRLLTFDGLSMRFDELKLVPEPDCVCRQSVCAAGTERQALSQANSQDLSQANSQAVSPTSSQAPAKVRSLSCEALRSKLEAGENLLLVDVRTDKERKVMRFTPSYFAPLPVEQEELSAWLEAGAAYCTGTESSAGVGSSPGAESATGAESCSGAESGPGASGPGLGAPEPAPLQVVVYCRSGQRSLSGTASLVSLGVDAVNLEGGILAWYKLYQDYRLTSDVSTGDGA